MRPGTRAAPHRMGRQRPSPTLANAVPPLILAACPLGLPSPETNYHISSTRFFIWMWYASACALGAIDALLPQPLPPMSLTRRVFCQRRTTATPAGIDRQGGAEHADTTQCHPGRRHRQRNPARHCAEPPHCSAAGLHPQDSSAALKQQFFEWLRHSRRGGLTESLARFPATDN